MICLALSGETPSGEALSGAQVSVRFTEHLFVTPGRYVVCPFYTMPLSFIGRS